MSGVMLYGQVKFEYSCQSEDIVAMTSRVLFVGS